MVTFINYIYCMKMLLVCFCCIPCNCIYAEKVSIVSRSAGGDWMPSGNESPSPIVSDGLWLCCVRWELAMMMVALNIEYKYSYVCPTSLSPLRESSIFLRQTKVLTYLYMKWVWFDYIEDQGQSTRMAIVGLNQMSLRAISIDLDLVPFSRHIISISLNQSECE